MTALGDGSPKSRRQAVAARLTAIGWILCLGSILSGPVAAQTPAAFTPWQDVVLYFVMLDRWADGEAANNLAVDIGAKGTFHGGDLRGLRAHLDEITGLGVTAIWITPVVKNVDGFVTGAGFPDWAYHGYWPDDFTRLDPRFGTEADLKALVDDCHQRGVRVLLDVVYNHAGYNSRYLSDPKTKGWLRSNETGTCGKDDLTLCVAGLPDWKTELPEVDSLVMRPQLDLARRAGIDGFRLDTVKHIDHPFWKEHRRLTRERLSADFFLLGEVWGGDAGVLDPWFAGDELDAGFDFGFEGSVVGFLLGNGRTVAFDRYLKMREKTRPGHLLAHFLSSHDVKGALSLLGGDSELFLLAAILQFTSVGIPVICWGDEVGRVGGDWPDNRSDMPWGERAILPGAGKPRNEAMRASYTKLIGIRRAHSALSRGFHTGLSTKGDLLIFSQTDTAAADAVVIAINRGTTPAVATFKAPALWGGSTVEDLWGGVSFAAPGDSMTTTVPSRSARILVAQARDDQGK
jgi:alpha-amylase